MRSVARIAVLFAFLCGITAAKISLQSSTAQTFRAETDGAGRFVLRNIPADDYKVEARKEGFFVLAGQTITLRSGSNDVTLTLKHAEELHEQVQVTAVANQIDTQDTAQRESITAREIRDIPVPNSHVLQESLTALPEVVRDNAGGLHIAGARS